MEYFGKNWGAPVCEDCEHVNTPVGKICLYCGEPIVESDRGLLLPQGCISDEVRDPVNCPIHLECMIRSAVGSLGHLRRTCSCFGGEEEDPPNMTKRQAAIAAFNEFNLRGIDEINPKS